MKNLFSRWPGAAKVRADFLGGIAGVLGLLSVGSSIGIAAEFSPPIVNDPTRPSQKPLLKLQPKTVAPQAPEFKLPTAPQESLPKAGQITVDRIQFTGNTVYSDAELQKLARPYLHRPLQVADLQELRQRCTALYTDAGYINSGAVIPAQSAAAGVLQIKIIEGKLTQVELQGMERLSESYIRDRLLLGAGTPLNLKNLQDAYQRLLASPLIDRLNGNLLPGTKPGESTLLIKVSRARPYQLYADADNYTTPLIGGYSGRIGGWLDNLSGFGERWDAEFLAAEGALGVNTGLDIPLNAYDTHATFRYSRTGTRLVDKYIKDLNIKTTVTAFEGGLSQPLYRDSGMELKAGINFSVRESDSTQQGTPASFTEGVPASIGTTQATVLRLWQQYMYQGQNNALVLRSTFNQGLNALGATIQDKHLPSGEFFSWLGQTQYVHQVLPNGAQVVLKGAVQLADQPLLPLERFAVGGVYSVRGYRENYYVRDNGFNTGLEFRYPLFGGESGARHSLYVIPFMDYGGAWNNPTRSQRQPDTSYLHSVGIGFNWHYERLNAEFYWAHALNSVPLVAEQHSQDDGIHFKVSLAAF